MAEISTAAAETQRTAMSSMAGPADSRCKPLPLECWPGWGTIRPLAFVTSAAR